MKGLLASEVLNAALEAEGDQTKEESCDVDVNLEAADFGVNLSEFNVYSVRNWCENSRRAVLVVV